MENLPCSRVVHNYRWKPYKFDKRLLLRNNARLAKVWMDNYAKFYFEWKAPDMVSGVLVLQWQQIMLFSTSRTESLGVLTLGFRGHGQQFSIIAVRNPSLL